MKNRLTEGLDFYYNDAGLMVLTEAYHLARGYCCGSGCRHCPYDYEAVPEPGRSLLKSKISPDGKEKGGKGDQSNNRS